MAVQTTAHDGACERRILIGMITSKSVLGRITGHGHGRLFRSRWANVVAALCTDYYKKHNTAPGKAIETLHETWAASQRDRATVDLVESFLSSLSGEYVTLAEDVNPEHVVDLAGAHFREVALEVLKEDLAAALDAHDLERAEHLVSTYRKMELGVGAGVDLFNDKEEIKALFADDDTEVLVQYPGALREFFGTDLARDAFVVFEGTAKSSKSFWLQDVAWRAMCSRKKVAYFEAGDLSKRQVELRFMVRAAGHPYRSGNVRKPYWPYTVHYPVAMEVDDDPKSGRRRARITSTRDKEYTQALDQAKAWTACQKVMQTQVKSARSHFKLSVHANSTLTVDTIRSVLDGYAADDFYPDICVIDYPDIMGWPAGIVDERTAINTTWKQLRRLSTELHGLVLAATQADADGYGQELLTRKNFSGDRRKNDHVTAMYGINATDGERGSEVCRLNVIARREGSYISHRCVHVAQCLALGRPAVLSSF